MIARLTSRTPTVMAAPAAASTASSVGAARTSASASPSGALAAFAFAVLAGMLGGCTPRSGPASPASEPGSGDGPYLLILGTAQDGGLPHAACSCPRCAAARTDPARARRIASLAIAWRWEWVGTAVCAGLGLLFLWWDANYRHNVPMDVLIIAGPLFLLAALFLLNWLKRTELRAGR